MVGREGGEGGREGEREGEKRTKQRKREGGDRERNEGELNGEEEIKEPIPHLSDSGQYKRFSIVTPVRSNCKVDFLWSRVFVECLDKTKYGIRRALFDVGPPRAVTGGRGGRGQGGGRRGGVAREEGGGGCGRDG